MKDNRIKSIVRGLAIIAFAVCLLLSKTAAFSAYPLIKIGMCIILGLILIEQLFEKSIIGVCFPLGIAACLFQKELGLGSVHYAVIILAFLLIGIGLSFIFGKKPRKYYEHWGKDYIDGHEVSEYVEDDGRFDLDNGFGSKSQYVKINNLKRGSIDNGFGNLKVYFDGTTVAEDGAFLDIDNGLGTMAIYFPKEFRVSFNCDNGLGKITMHGECSQDTNQPLVNVKVDNGLGAIDFYFE